VHPVDRTRVAVALAGVPARGGRERDVEIRLSDAEGRYHAMSWTFAAGSGPHSILGVGHELPAPPTGWWPVTPDTAALERRNAELATRLADLEERFTAVERFAGTAAHQLAEPLVVAECSAILIAEELGPDLDPMLRGRLDAIGRSASRARRLMDALLADARTSGQPPEVGPVDLGPLVEEALGTLELQLEARAATAVVGRLPTVLGEAGLLGVIVENLLSNALKYGPRAGGTIVIDAQRCAEGWRITFVDEGKPIPADQVSRIFEPFHRVPGERRIPGVGLGLTVSTRLAGRLGGTIGVDPGGDSGNTFWLLLPDAA
jgi:signal transduction histidine kinase